MEIQIRLNQMKTWNKVYLMNLMIHLLTNKKNHSLFSKATLLKAVLYLEKERELWILWDSNRNLWTNNRFSTKLSLCHCNKIECKFIIIPTWILIEFKLPQLMWALTLIWKTRVSIPLKINNFNSSNNIWCNKIITWPNNKRM